MIAVVRRVEGLFLRQGATEKRMSKQRQGERVRTGQSSGYFTAEKGGTVSVLEAGREA